MARIKKRYENPAPDPVAAIVRTQEEIDIVLTTIESYIESESTDYPDMTYEDGLRTMYNWLTGETDQVPA